MAVGDRVDPVLILALVGGVRPGIGGSERAFQVLVDKVGREGWVVSDIEFDDVGESTECGSVVVEGIPYRAHYGLRVRRDLVDDSENDLRQRSVLGFAAWLEPDLKSYDHKI